MPKTQILLISKSFDMICNCGATEIPDVPLYDCVEKIGQVQKILLQKTYASSGVRNSLTIATANPNVIATWTPLLAAADATKVVQSPFMSSVEWGEGEAVTDGGGEDSIDGVEEIVATDPTTFAGRLYKTHPASIKALKNYGCLDLSVCFINQYGKIVGESEDSAAASPTTFYFIPIQTFWVGDLVGGGRTGRDYYPIRFSLPENWSNDLYFVTPSDFDAKIDLVTP